MSDRLKMAFAEAGKLPEDEQDAFAAFLLAELEDERHWNSQFGASGDVLSRLAAEARAEHAAGKTRPLDEMFQ